MSITQVVFQANLNADKIYVDLSYLPDTIRHTFWLSIRNQSTTTFWFRLVCLLPNWSIESPTDGKLGSVTGASTGVFTATIIRSKPSSETVDSGQLKIEAYRDSTYIDKVGEATLNVTAYIEDTENWTDKILYDFNDGTSQGWTLASNMSIANDMSVEPGGYSVRADEFSDTTRSYYISRTIAIPNRDKVRLTFYLLFRARSTGPTTATALLRNLYVKVDTTDVFAIPFSPILGGLIPGNATIWYGWYKFTLDLSAFKGQAKTVRISWEERTDYAYLFATAWLDRIVIAGKD